jgi:hypothetical protein
MINVYQITAEFKTVNAELATKTLILTYRSHLVLSQHSWLVAAGGSARELCDLIQNKTGNDATIFVSKLSAAIAWSKPPSKLASWLPLQLAASDPMLH